MEQYLATYGWHFSKAMARFASAHFHGNMPLIEREVLEKLFRNTSAISAAKGCDIEYLCNRIRTICPELSEKEMVRLVDSYISHTYDTCAFTEFYADCVATGTPIIWEDML